LAVGRRNTDDISYELYKLGQRIRFHNYDSLEEVHEEKPFPFLKLPENCETKFTVCSWLIHASAN